MGFKLLSNPAIEINDEKIAIYGNSAEFDNGLPDINVTSITAGSGSYKTVHGVDGTTAVGEFKFKLPATAESDALVTKWKKLVATNTIKFYEDDLSKTMLSASCSEGRKFEMNSGEGGIEVIFRGDAMET